MVLIKSVKNHYFKHLLPSERDHSCSETPPPNSMLASIRTPSWVTILLTIVVILGLTGCGMKGPLELPTPPSVPETEPVDDS